MRLEPATLGLSHPRLNLVNPDDHHPDGESFTIDSQGVQSLPPGTTFDLDIALGTDQYNTARVIIQGEELVGPSGPLWRVGAEVYATRDVNEAIAHSIREATPLPTRVYVATYAKQNGDAYLTHKVFNVAGALYIALDDAVLTGSNLRLTFHNYFGGSAFLWVRGQAICW